MASPTSASASRAVLPASSVSRAAKLCELAAHELGGAEQHGGALARRRVAPRRERRAGGLHGGLGLARAGDLDHAHHAGGVGRVDRLGRGDAALVAPADEQRLVAGRPGRGLAQRLQGGAAALEPGEVGVRHVGEGAGRGGVGGRHERQVGRRLVEAGRRRRRGDQLLDVGALDEGAAQERLVGGVLEQAPHEVGHAGNGSPTGAYSRRRRPMARTAP